MRVWRLPRVVAEMILGCRKRVRNLPLVNRAALISMYGEGANGWIMVSELRAVKGSWVGQKEDRHCEMQDGSVTLTQACRNASPA